jgi:HlyD family secretion protein
VISERGRRLVPGLLLWVMLILCCGCDDENKQFNLSEARRGNLEVTLLLDGYLKAVREKTIMSPGWGNIRWLEPNGSTVKKGQQVLELDSEHILKAIRDHQADLDVRAAELEQTKLENEISKRQAALRLSSAKLHRQLQEARLAELEARPTVRELADARNKLKLAKTLLEASKENLVLVKELSDLGFSTSDELSSAKLELFSERANLAAALAGLALVKAGTPASKLQQARINLVQARLSEESAERNIKITEEWTGGKLARFSRRLQRENEKLAGAKTRLMQCKAFASHDGVVLHKSRRWGGTWRPGQRVWMGAKIMSIPDLTRMKVSVQIPASFMRQLETLEKISAKITIPALPGKTFKGQLGKISTMGQDEFESMEGSKHGVVGRAERQVFDAEVEILDDTPQLKPGCSAKLELLIQTIQDAIIVPRMSVHLQESASEMDSSQDDSPAVKAASIYVWKDGYFEARTVNLLASTRFFSAISGPVEVGDKVFPGTPPEDLIRNSGQ